jgi:biopolymer transport protein ExbD
MKFFRKPTPEAGFDLTAMIDVVLLLIIFFMLSSQFAQSQARPMDLPRERGEATQPPAPTAIIVDIAKDGTMSVLSGQAVSGDELVKMVKQAEAKHNGTPGAVELVIRADRGTPSLYVNKLAGLLARSGIRAWKLATAGDAA